MTIAPGFEIIEGTEESIKTLIDKVEGIDSSTKDENVGKISTLPAKALAIVFLSTGLCYSGGVNEHNQRLIIGNDRSNRNIKTLKRLDISQNNYQNCVSQIINEEKAISSISDLEYVSVGDLNELRKKATKLVLSLNILKQNWDGFGAIPSTINSVLNTLEMINYFEADILGSGMEISPNPHGTISLKWEFGEDILDLEIGNNELSYYFETDKHEDIIERHIQPSKEVANRISEKIRNIC